MAKDKFVHFECDIGYLKAFKIMNEEYPLYHIVPGTYELHFIGETGDHGTVKCVLELDPEFQYG